MDHLHRLVRPILQQLQHVWQTPWVWPFIAAPLLLPHLGLWVNAATDTGFHPLQLSEALSTSANTTNSWSPVLAASLTAAMLRRSSQQGLQPTDVLAALAAIAVMMTAVTAASFIITLPFVLPAHVLWRWSEIAPLETQPWLPALAVLAKSIWATLPTAALTALLTAATRVPQAAAAIAVIYRIPEYVWFDLTIGNIPGAHWVAGILMSQLQRYWIHPESIGHLPNILGLTDGQQALIFLGIHTAWITALTLILLRLRPFTSGQFPPASFSDWRRKLTAVGTITTAALAVTVAAGIIAIFATEQPSPYRTATTYLEHRHAEIAQQVTEQAFPDHRESAAISRSIADAYGSSITPFKCPYETPQRLSRSPQTITCTAGATFRQPMAANVRATIELDVARSRGILRKPIVIRAELAGPATVTLHNPR